MSPLRLPSGKPTRYVGGQTQVPQVDLHSAQPLIPGTAEQPSLPAPEHSGPLAEVTDSPAATLYGAQFEAPTTVSALYGDSLPANMAAAFGIPASQPGSPPPQQAPQQVPPQQAAPPPPPSPPPAQPQYDVQHLLWRNDLLEKQNAMYAEQQKGLEYFENLIRANPQSYNDIVSWLSTGKPPANLTALEHNAAQQPPAAAAPGAPPPSAAPPQQFQPQQGYQVDPRLMATVLGEINAIKVNQASQDLNFKLDQMERQYGRVFDRVGVLQKMMDINTTNVDAGFDAYLGTQARMYAIQQAQQPPAPPQQWYPQQPVALPPQPSNVVPITQAQSYTHPAARVEPPRARQAVPQAQHRPSQRALPYSDDPYMNAQNNVLQKLGLLG